MTPAERQQAFALQVVLGTEYYDSGQSVVQWRKNPSLSVFNGTAEDHETIRQIVGELNSILRPARFSVKLLKPRDSGADIQVIFAPKNEFEEIAALRGFQYVPHNRGYFYLWWNPGREIRRAVVLIDSGLSGRMRRHYIREEITQALGLSSDSPLYKDSVFYAKGRDGGRAKTFSELDRKLIYFFYKRLRPGNDRKDVLKAFERYWNP